MKLEQGKRYLTRSGMITPPLNSRHGGISFDLPDVGDLSSSLRWLPDGTCDTSGTLDSLSRDLDLVAEVQNVYDCVVEIDEMYSDGGVQR